MAASRSMSRAAAPALSVAQAWTLSITATLVMTVSYVDRQTLAAISPTVRTALGIDHTQYGWLTSAFSLAYLAFAPLSGALIDRVGCRIGLVVAVLGWSVVSGLHALAPTFGALFALRIALGVTESPSFPGAAQVVRRALPPSRRSAGFGLLFTGSSVGAMIAAPLAILILKATSWRAVFVGTAIVGLAWVPGWLVVSGSQAARAALDHVPAMGEDAAAERGSWRDLLGDPAVLRALVLVVASAPAISFNLNWLPQYLTSVHGVTQVGLAAYVWMPMLVFDLGAVGFGALASRRERAAPGHASHRDLVAVAGAACATMALMPLCPGPLSAVLLASVANAGGGGLYSLLTGDMLARVAPSRVSMAGGMTAAAQSLAYIVANPLVGMSIDRSHQYGTALVALGAIVVPGAAAWIVWPVRTPRRA